MKLEPLINFYKEKYPEKTIEICEAIDLLIDSLNNIKSEIGKSVFALFDNDEYDLVDEYKNHARMTATIINRLNDISNRITVDETLELDNESEYNNTEEINYNNDIFNVDSKIPHTLYEDFTYTKPAGIKIENTYLKAIEWRDIFNMCCQYLLKKDEKLFLSFLDDISMQGRTRKYFSKTPDQLREPELITGSDIYLECNVNAIFVRNIIIKMLEKYEIPKRHCHIFIRRDLTSLHNNSIKKHTTTKKLEESNNEIKIGQYAKEYFTSYFQTDNSEEEINNFTNKEWCHNTFGICYPILKQVDINIPINEQVNYNNQYRRYYTNPVLKINEKNYIICSQWFASFKPKLIDWINSKSEKSIVNVNENHILEVGDKIKFSKDYSSITIPKVIFVDILNEISKYDNRPFETGNLSSMFSTLINRNSNYEKPHHVINNIRKYLEHEKIISLYGESKKGKYIIINSDKLYNLIKRYNEQNEMPNCDTTIQKREVVIYGYTEKEQIIIDVANPNEKYAHLHNYCINKQPGYKFNIQSNEYVIVNYKKSYFDNEKDEEIKISSENLNDIKQEQKFCIQCGEPVFHGSPYCWEHYKYHHSESK